jgi:hypothetical protein
MALNSRLHHWILSIAAIFTCSVSFGRASHHASGPYYGGGHHTTSHGGHYFGGHGLSHRGGYYVNPRTGNQYGHHQPAHTG